MTDHRRSHPRHSPIGVPADAPTVGSPQSDRDVGFSMVEVLVTIVIFGILATIVTFAVSGLRAQAAESTCAADERILWTATEAYFDQMDISAIPPTGVDHDRYERTLVADGFLRLLSDHHDLDATGSTTPEGTSPC